MLGAIIGDIAGSRFEWNNHKSKDFELFSDRCFFTDDTVMTIAVGKALLESRKNRYDDLEKQLIRWMHEIGRNYPYCGYGGRFYYWIMKNQKDPYRSFGNGSAMRTSLCGEIATSLDEALELGMRCAAVTHDHPEGIRGAQAVSACIYLAKEGKSLKEIRRYVNDHFYVLDFTLKEIRPFYSFNETCQGTVPQAIEAFLEAESFEDAIRNAISIGGDSDTLAAITGSMAEAFFSIPQELKEKAKTYLDDYLLQQLPEDIWK